MATFYGAEQLLRVLRFTGTSGTLYTAPANTSAVVRVTTAVPVLGAGTFNIGDGNANNEIQITSASHVKSGHFTDGSGDIVVSSNEVWMFDGDTIEVSGMSNFECIVKEYKNP